MKILDKNTFGKHPQEESLVNVLNEINDEYTLNKVGKFLTELNVLTNEIDLIQDLKVKRHLLKLIYQDRLKEINTNPLYFKTKPLYTHLKGIIMGKTTKRIYKK